MIRTAVLAAALAALMIGPAMAEGNHSTSECAGCGGGPARDGRDAAGPYADRNRGTTSNMDAVGSTRSTYDRMQDGRGA